MEFVRGKEPKDALNLGNSHKVKVWFVEHNTVNADYSVRENGNIITVQVHGSLVLERFDSFAIEGVNCDYRVEIGEVSGTCVILNLLGSQQIYEKIKSFYTRVLDNCLGKNSDEQYEYLFGKDSEVRSAGGVNIVRTLREGLIENSEELIRGLPDVPSDRELLNIVDEILSNKRTGKLEYASEVMDDCSVKLGQYAREILKRFKNS